ncbi:TPR repeat [hydrothermal vent metagenome]|uniref:TPR repeat n=1 Tax=hydrothermal vent metagenome TaxID=652676 RepID=A0A3B1CT97_9ZZZZ
MIDKPETVKSYTTFTGPLFSSILHSLIIFIVLVFAYQGTFTQSFKFDSEWAVRLNENIRDLSDIKAIWSFNPSRFLTFLSLAVNYHFGELDVFGYHLVNFLIHFLNALLVYWLARVIISTRWGVEAITGPEGGEPSSGLARLFPLFVAILFAIHPIQTESVTYIWQRNTSLSAFFYLFSMILYLKSSLCNEPDGGKLKNRSRFYFAGSLFFAVCAMCAKQISITLPVTIVMLELFFVSGSIARLREKTVRLAAFIPILLIIPALTALGMNQEIKDVGAFADSVVTHKQYLLTQLNVIVMYLKLLVAPVGLNLDYDFPLANSFLDSAVSFVILSALAGLGFALFNKNRVVSFSILFFFLTISVESSIFPLADIVFEHRTYLPSVGFFLVFGVIAFQMADRLRRVNAHSALLVFLAVTVAAMAFGARARNEAWKDNETLWSDVIKKSPGKARGYLNLGVFYFKNGDNKKAEKLFRQALIVDPKSTFSLFKLARIYERKKLYQKMISPLERAIKINPALIDFRYALANTYHRNKMYSKAVRQYRIVIRLGMGKLVQPHLNLASALALSGHVDESIKALKEALKVDPDNATALGNLGALYTYKGDKEKAQEYLQRAKPQI